MARTTWTSKLKPGDYAPAFEVELQDGGKISNESLKGYPYILFFYPADNTPTCTKEACNMRDNYDGLTEAGYKVFGVSKDSAKKHINFIDKYDLPFPLIVDTDNELAKKFDIFGEKKFMGRVSMAIHRTTFVIDAKGVIEKVIHPVIATEHAEQILG